MKAQVKGSESWVNQKTGEIVETETVVKYGDFDFHKLWLAHILDVVDQVGNSKMQVLMWLLKNMNNQNLIHATTAEIGNAVGCHRNTVSALLKSLEDCGVITRPAQGRVRISPKMIFKGGHSKRMNVLIKYRDEEQMDLFEQAEDEKAA